MSAGVQTYVKQENGNLHRYTATQVLNVGILRENRRLMSAGVQTYVKRGNGDFYQNSPLKKEKRVVKQVTTLNFNRDEIT